MTAKSDELINELISASIAFADWQARIETARCALKAHIEELEVETETVAGDYEDRMDNLINMGNETGRLLQSEIGYLNAQLNIKNETTKFLQLRIAELKGVIEILEDQQREVKNILIDKNLHIDSLYEEGYKLQQRIAELEHRNKVLEDACEMLRKENGRVTQLLDFWKGLSTNGSKVQE